MMIFYERDFPLLNLFAKTDLIFQDIMIILYIFNKNNSKIQ